MKQKALFLDRDGIINIDKAYVHTQEQFEFMPGIFELLRRAQSKGYLLIIVTNQSGIGRGYYTENDFQALTTWMLKEFKKKDIRITAIYHCPHLPEENCHCRKPNPGMILHACRDHNISPQKSWFIGDNDSDMQAGLNAKIGTLLWMPKSKSIDPHTHHKNIKVISNLEEAQTLLNN